MSVIDRHSERDPFNPDWLSVDSSTVNTEHVLYVEVQVQRFTHPVILTKPAPEVWNKHIDRATSIALDRIEFVRSDSVPPTIHNKGVLVFTDQDKGFPFPLVVAREIVSEARQHGWKAQVHALDYARWVSGTV